MRRILLCLLLVTCASSAHAQNKPRNLLPPITLPQPPQLTGDLLADIKAKLGGIPDIQAKLDAIKSSLPPLKSPIQTNTDIEQAITAIEAVTVKDLQDAVAVFDSAKNYAGSNCFKALLDVVQANVTANASIAASAAAAPADPTAADGSLPIQHAFLVIAKIYNIVVANHPGGALKLQCAAMKDDLSSSGPISALLGSGAFSKILPVLKIIGLGA